VADQTEITGGKSPDWKRKEKKATQKHQEKPVGGDYCAKLVNQTKKTKHWAEENSTNSVGNRRTQRQKKKNRREREGKIQYQGRITKKKNRKPVGTSLGQRKHQRTGWKKKKKNGEKEAFGLKRVNEGGRNRGQNRAISSVRGRRQKKKKGGGSRKRTNQGRCKLERKFGYRCFKKNWRPS